ncbi:TetR/AcrR family transcriptional regulator [Corynebacterium lactis]|nr:TetR/AcrR family transcriptional regulator [Corynebacterium lactis]
MGLLADGNLANERGEKLKLQVMGSGQRNFTSRQQALFDALMRDVLNEGFADFTVDAAARRYRCSKSTMYSLGANRDEILRGVIVEFFRGVARATEPVWVEDGVDLPCVEVLEGYFAAIARALEPASEKFMRDLLAEPVAQEVYSVNTAAAVKVVDGILSAGVEFGEFSIESVGFVSRLIQRSLQDIQSGVYLDVLPNARAYAAFGELVIRGLER